jgi:hypothetical protein
MNWSDRFPVRRYSESTECPECHCAVHFGRLVAGRGFACPNCKSTVRVSRQYERTTQLLAWALGLLIPYLVGARPWFLLLAWGPCTMALMFLWPFIGMPFLPPKLERCAMEPPSVLGLGPKL